MAVHDQLQLGILATTVGGIVGVVLFVPFVAISYRRRGGLSLSRLMLWASALVYFWAIWTYTLLPLPDPDTMRCAGVNLDPFELVNDIRNGLASPGPWIADPGILQLLLNVLLFVPLGFFVRVLGGRGILVAGLVGAALTLFIETTQLTGVWGLYPCAYRVFDVDDMITNTTGALVGSIIALVVPARMRGSARAADADLPRPVTRGRRALAIFCDVVGFATVSVTVTIGVQLWLEYVAQAPDLVAAADVAGISGTVVALVLWSVIGLATGASPGDLAVMLRYEGGPLPTALARPLRLLGGIVGFTLVDALPDPWSLAGIVFLLVAVVSFFATRAGRGLPGLLTGRNLVDSRGEPGSARPGDVSPAAETPVPRP